MVGRGGAGGIDVAAAEGPRVQCQLLVEKAEDGTASRLIRAWPEAGAWFARALNSRSWFGA